MAIHYDENLHFEKLNYNSYLKIDELFSLQKEVSDPPHHDEMFFIIIHQATELWFKEIMHETKVLIQSLREPSISRALKTLRRMNRVMELLVQQINLLSTLTPVEFSGFRESINPASGFQSASFRKLEFTYGIRDNFFLQFFNKILPEVVEELKEIQKQPAVYDEFLSALNKAGYSVPKDVLSRDVTQNYQTSHPEVVKLIKEIYENPGKNYHWVLLCEALLDFDEKLTLFRKTHIVVVERCIGRKVGTGGSSGVEFLESRANLKLFPELWDVRTEIGVIGGS